MISAKHNVMSFAEDRSHDSMSMSCSSLKNISTIQAGDNDTNIDSSMIFSRRNDSLIEDKTTPAFKMIASKQLVKDKSPYGDQQTTGKSSFHPKTKAVVDVTSFKDAMKSKILEGTTTMLRLVKASKINGSFGNSASSKEHSLSMRDDSRQGGNASQGHGAKEDADMLSGKQENE